MLARNTSGRAALVGRGSEKSAKDYPEKSAKALQNPARVPILYMRGENETNQLATSYGLSTITPPGNGSQCEVIRGKRHG